MGSPMVSLEYGQHIITKPLTNQRKDLKERFKHLSTLERIIFASKNLCSYRQLAKHLNISHTQAKRIYEQSRRKLST